MTKGRFTLALLLLPFLGFSQDEDLRFYDFIYLDNIRSVKFHVEGLLISTPIVELGSSAALELSFDDMDGDYKEYVYSVVHCDANWQPSRLVESEYLNGFSESEIEEYDFSFKTKSIYTHYRLFLPNQDMDFSKSGNYLLKVYENEGDKRLALTRRFMIVESSVKIYPDVARPAIVSKADTHQEIDFSITHDGFEIRNPRQEISATILQNGRWDNAITGVIPRMTRLEEQLFDYQDKIVFPAGKEFRFLDLRSLKYANPSIAFIEFVNDGYEVVMQKDEKRGQVAFFEWNDINGNFIIENMDETARLFPNFQRDTLSLANAGKLDREDRLSALDRASLESSEETFNTQIHHLESEYASVLFSLASPGEMYESDVYIFGGLTDWQLKPQFKMTYNPAVNAYVAKVPLKQGYYNYFYAVLPKGAAQPDFEETEGDWYETENLYTILIYYRPFGGRYDRLIGVYSFTSRT